MSAPARLQLSDAQIERYSRQIILPEIGAVRQQTLLATAIAVAGDSEVASYAIRYLMAAGIGQIRLIDPAPPGGFFAAQNPDSRLAPLDPEQNSLNSCSVVLDCSDSFELHDRLNRACVRDRVPFVVASATGTITTLVGANAACFACVADWPAATPSGDDHLSSVTAALMGTMAATEVLKCVLAIGETLAGRVLRFDAQRADFVASVVAQNPACRICQPTE